MTDEKAPAKAIADAQPDVANTEEDPDTDQFAAQESSEKDKPKHRGWINVSLIVAGIVVGAASIGFVVWSQLEIVKSDFSGVSQSIEAQVSRLEADQEITRQSLLKDVDNRRAEVEARLRDFNETVNSLRNLMAQTTQSDQDGLVIAEVDYLLQLANYRIELEHNRKGAILAVSQAQSRLGSLSADAYKPILDQIATDKAILKEVVAPEISLIVQTLSAMLARVDELRTGSEKIAPQGESPSADERKKQGWDAIFSAFGENLSQFVKIERAEGATAPTLIPSQEHLARENVRLALESARACAIRRDTENFRLALTEAGLWLDSYFGASSEAGYMQGELEHLGQIDLVPVYPNFHDSLELIRKFSELTPTSADSGENTNSQTGLQTKESAIPDASVEPTIDMASDSEAEILEPMAEENGGTDSGAKDNDGHGALVEGESL